MFFDCIVSELLWKDVFKIFYVMISDFLALASKWLCNTRYLQLNIVSSAVFLEHLEQ
jgi:hypothetical protein